MFSVSANGLRRCSQKGAKVKGSYLLGRRFQSLLGGSGVVISGVISLLIWVIGIVSLLITPLMTTHEPPSSS